MLSVPVMGNNLKKLRIEHGWTHDQAASAVGVSRSQFIKLERGERRLTADYIAQAARGLGYAHRRRDLEGRPLQIVHRDFNPDNIL